MPGDWHKRGKDLDLKVGSLLEGAVTDNDGRPQGTIVLGIKAIGKEHQGHPTVEAAFLGYSDAHYQCGWRKDKEGRSKNGRGTTSVANPRAHVDKPEENDE